MWIVQPEENEDSSPLFSVIHLNKIVRAAHLIGHAGHSTIPHELQHYHSLDTFTAFYINKFADYHAHQLAF